MMKILKDVFYEERPITPEECNNLKSLLFQDRSRKFSSHWLKQGFKFRSDTQTYGLIQNYSGPCGVLAAIQAQLIFQFLFGYTQSVLVDDTLKPDSEEQKLALAYALTCILFQAGGNKQAILAVKGDERAFDDEEFVIDGLTEYLYLKTFKVRPYLLEYFINMMPSMMSDEMSSCVTFLYSVMLTRGLENIRTEMDEEIPLIGCDGFCSLEIINLLLTGKAVTNAFDGHVTLDDEEDGSGSTFHGIERTCNIGLLSKNEYNGSMTIGKHYKNPKFPIWLLHTVNHFSVLFSTDKNYSKRPKIGEKFNLIHYDAYVDHDDEQIYEIEIMKKSEKSEANGSTLQCILSKWPTARINGDEEESDSEETSGSENSNSEAGDSEASNSEASDNSSSLME